MHTCNNLENKKKTHIFIADLPYDYTYKFYLACMYDFLFLIFSNHKKILFQ